MQHSHYYAARHKMCAVGPDPPDQGKNAASQTYSKVLCGVRLSPPGTRYCTTRLRDIQSNVTYPTTSGPGPCWITEYVG